MAASVAPQVAGRDVPDGCRARDVAPRPAIIVMRDATGMLDAILLALDPAGAVTPDRIWITWCDQIGIHPRTVAKLAQMSDEHPSAYAILPTANQAPPYIHLLRDAK